MLEVNLRNPLIEQRADPFIYKHTDGYYYFTGSVPEYDRIELRRAQTLEGLIDAEKVTIWVKHSTGLMSANIWAPEIHFIDGKWYVYFAAAVLQRQRMDYSIIACSYSKMHQRIHWRAIGLRKLKSKQNGILSPWMRPPLSIRADDIMYGPKKTRTFQGIRIYISLRWRILGH